MLKIPYALIFLGKGYYIICGKGFGIASTETLPVLTDVLSGDLEVQRQAQ